MERRVKRLRRQVWAAGHLQRFRTPNGVRENVWFVTLTYRRVHDWQPRHISKCLKAARRWCHLRGVPFRYLWIAELQQRGALHYHLAIWLPKRLRVMEGGDLVALAFASVKHSRTKHWALAVGVEGAAVGKVHTADTILLLDPSAGEPAFSPANARLRLPMTGPGSRRASPNVPKSAEDGKRKPVHWLYEAAEWSAEEVRLLAAIRLQLKAAG